MVFSGAAGSWVFCASAVDNNRTKKIGRMAMRRSISGSFIFVKASMNTPAGQFCATVDLSAPCPRLPSALPHSFDRLTISATQVTISSQLILTSATYPQTKPARKHFTKVARKALIGVHRSGKGARLWHSSLRHRDWPVQERWSFEDRRTTRRFT